MSRMKDLFIKMLETSQYQDKREGTGGRRMIDIRLIKNQFEAVVLAFTNINTELSRAQAEQDYLPAEVLKLQDVIVDGTEDLSAKLDRLKSSYTNLANQAIDKANKDKE